MASNSDPQSNLKRRIIISAVLLAVFAALTGWLFYEQSTSWPHEGSWTSLVNLFLCPGIVFQSFVLLYAGFTGRVLTRRVLTRIVTVPLGLIFGATLAQWGSNLAMSNFERAYTPFVAEIGANLAEPCGRAAKYFAIPAVSAYNAQTFRRPTANLNYDTKRFVVSFSGGSFDMDGSKIYYDSGAKRWSKFHNNSETATQTFEKLIEGLAACRLHSEPAPK